MQYHVFCNDTILIIKFHDLLYQRLCIYQALLNNYDTYLLHYQNSELKLLAILVLWSDLLKIHIDFQKTLRVFQKIRQTFLCSFFLTLLINRRFSDYDGLGLRCFEVTNAPHKNIKDNNIEAVKLDCCDHE